MYRSRGPRRYWPRSRAGGCLLWIVLLVVVLIVLSLLFGGFQKGTKANSLAVLAPHAVICAGCGARGPGDTAHEAKIGEDSGFGETFVHYGPQNSPGSPNSPSKTKIIALAGE
jgi:hypothetical protein